MFLYAIHPVLNNIINKFNQKELATIVFLMAMMFSILRFVVSYGFFYSEIIGFICIYFYVGYLKKYLGDFQKSRKKNFILLLFSMVGIILLIIVSNYMGLHIKMLEDQVTRWNSCMNLFNVLMGISLFNIFRFISFKSRIINYVSGLSLLIYIISENIVFRECIKPYVFEWIYKNYGYSFICFWVVLISIATFFFSIVIGSIYRILVRKLKPFIVNKEVNFIKEQYKKIFH